MCILDLVVTDEFGEPFFFACEPVIFKEGLVLFDNRLNMDFHSQDGGETRVSSIKFESADKKV
jgi:hypothetical protein